VTVVPITSNVTHVYPFQVALPVGEGSGLSVDSKAQAEQVRAVDIQRVGPALGQLPAGVMTQLDAALRLHLAL
jgi:mRNA interferase MazF